jgi:hypothetical protein
VSSVGACGGGRPCWGSVEITKIYYLRNPELPKIYLCSNTATINGDSVTYPCRPNAGIALPHKSWRWRQRSRPQDREDLDMAIPVRQHRRNDLVSHVQHLWYLYTYSEQWLLPDLGSSQDCGSRSVWIRSGVHAGLCRAAMESPSLLRSPLGSHTREREERGVAHEGERKALPRSSLNPRVSNSPPGVLLL